MITEADEKGEKLDFALHYGKQQESMKIKRLIGQPEAAHSLKTAHCVALYSSSSSWEAGSEEESCLACAK